MARFKCERCGSKAIQTSRNEITSRISELYVVCTNTKECGVSYVVSETFKHYTNPPTTSTVQMAAEIINLLPKSKQLELLNNIE